jgi:glycosyltransferase involved in cell wall biosynthesis
MKILRVVGQMYPSVVGGIGLHAHELSKHQAELGHDITVYAIDNGCEQPRTNYELLKFKDNLSLFGNSISLGLLSKMLLTYNNFDIIHAHSHLFFSTNLCAGIKRIGSVPLVITNHGLISQTAPSWLSDIYIPTIAKWTFESADKIICYTEEEKKELVSLGINPDKISVIHNGIDTDLFAPALKKEKTNHLLWIGRFTPGKGVDYLIDAFGILLADFPDLVLVMVGKGPLKEHIHQKIKLLDLEKNVILYDFISNNELPDLYRRSDVFILSSIYEGVPRTILEAMSCGTPVVCTQLPQLINIVSDCGLLVPLRDPKAIADAVAKIICDNELAKKMGEKGRNRIVDKYCWNDSVKKIIKLYGEILCQRS